MTILHHEALIAAPISRVWSVLTDLAHLDRLDPGVLRSTLVGGPPAGLGAERQCDLKPGGWFRERVTTWVEPQELAFELYECTLPVARLRHAYVLSEEAGGTRVRQTMGYELKYGPLGQLLDVLMVRRQWDAGIKAFFQGLKRVAEEEGPLG